MEASVLNQILDQHKLWIDGKGGICADLCGASLYCADLTRANLAGANLAGANLNRANLSRADLTGADLRDAYLKGANLYDADLKGANLKGANLKGANLKGANLKGANLRNATLTNAILPDISWIKAGCLVQLNKVKYVFYLSKESKWENLNFVQDSLGFIVENNLTEKTFDMLVEDRVIRGIPDWVKLSGLKQIESV